MELPVIVSGHYNFVVRAYSLREALDAVLTDRDLASKEAVDLADLAPPDNFELNPASVRSNHRKEPGKGEESPAMGGVPLQGTA